jgi:hypothetical protein
MRTLQLLVSGPEATPTVRLIDIATGGELAAGNPAAADRPALDSAGIRARFGDPLRLQADLMKDGQRMFDWLTHGPIAAAWQAARVEGAHTLLEIADPALRDLPWELLSKGPVGYFGLPPDVARAHDGPVAPDNSGPWPVRMLVLVGTIAGNEKPGEKPLDTASEVRRIKHGLLRYRHSVDLEVEVQPTLARLQELLTQFQPHVFHFVGHSGISRTSGLPALFIQGAGAWELDAQQITASFTIAQTIPRLVFLNACHTGGSYWLSVAEAFTALGVPACLSMRGDIRDDRAGLFAATVYRRLWEGATIDAAVTVARRELQNVKPAATWAFPVLSLAAPADQVFRPRPKIGDEAERDERIELCKMFRDVRLFSGRARERRELREAFQPIAAGAQPRHFLVVTGDPRWGKSHIVKRCLECLALGGHNVHYVAFADDRDKNFVDVLVDILTSSDDCAVSPIPAAVLNEFKWDATQILTRGATIPWDGRPMPGPVPFAPDANKADDPVNAIFAAFWKALKNASTTRPLVIVLDQFRNSEADRLAVAPDVFCDLLWPHWLAPIRRGELPRVSVVVVLQTRDAEHVYKLSNLVLDKSWIRVADFSAKDYPELVEELFGYPEQGVLPGLEPLLKGYGEWLVQTGSPTVVALAELMRTAEGLYKDKHKELVGRSQ